jgi:hypothetical protein
MLPKIAFRGVSNFEREPVEKLRATFEDEVVLDSYYFLNLPTPLLVAE